MARDESAEVRDEVTLKDFKNIFSLDGKVAVVTGGSRGLGLHTASGFLQSGCSLVFITSRKADACESAVRALNALPNKPPKAKAVSVPADISKVEGVVYFVEQVKKHTDHVDILFANAGATWGASFDEHPDAAFGKVLDLNVRSVFNCVQKFAPLLAKNATIDDPSRVLTTSSVAGLGIGSTGTKNSTPAYSASKAAVIHLTRNLAMELGPRHILCNSIAPGFFPTKMANELMRLSGGRKALEDANPNGRLGLPEDIAALAVFLCGRGAGHINAETVAIDGGKLWARSKL